MLYFLLTRGAKQRRFLEMARKPRVQYPGVTDGLRALLLEWAGYRTKVFEFVASEHTPKNLMIAAIRSGAPFLEAAARERIVALKAFFGIQHHALDPLLDRTASQV